ncbi:transcriptional regulator MraZ [Spirochaetia bacterium]|nr:transcriptional regulator MraZ [Spirochaetia bacterium]
MNPLTGEFQNVLDDKGRASIPAKFREALPGNTLVLTKGIEHCVWLLPPEQWETVSANLMKTSSLSVKETNKISHRFIVPAQEAEIDKLGRVAIPQSLRLYAGLNRDIVVLGNGKNIEIWDTEQYRAYLDGNEDTLMDVLDKMGPIDLYS